MAYDRESATVRRRKESEQGRDIGAIPPVVDPERRTRGEKGLRWFCETYFAHRFHIPWSKDHIKAIDHLEWCIAFGGQFAFALPRGSGKTSLCEVAVQWALLTGQRQYVVLIGADADAALQRLDAIKADLQSNEMLAADFPEVCVPIVALEDEPRRCRGQTVEGERTKIKWGADAVVLPSVKGSKAAGARLEVAGITGGIRGRKFTRPDGQSVRPDLAVIDDPQTDQSARSPSQCAERERVLGKAVLGLAGPGKKIAAVMPCTVIIKGDMADRMLDRKLHPTWQGERMKALYAMPARVEMWERYKMIRDDSLRAGRGGSDATEFYRAHRTEMDEGAAVAWPERFEPDQLSGLESCMVAYLDDPASFAAERQNEPLEAVELSEVMSPQQIAEKFSRVARGVVPAGCEYLTAFVDVQEHALFWTVCAFAADMTGSVIDYGIFPDQAQQRTYFTYRDITAKLFMRFPGAGIGGAIAGGLAEVEQKLTLGRTFPREDGAPMRVAQQLVDIGWHQSADAIAGYCKRSTYGAVLLPSKGMGIGASATPVNEWPRKTGEKRGDNWVLTVKDGRRQVLFDANYWKTAVHKALSTVVGDRGCLTLFGEKADAHRMIADHLTSEYPVATSARGRTVNEWKTRPGKPDNHWFDCVVGCFVAASVAGAAVPGSVKEPPRERKVITFAEAKATRKVHTINRKVA